MTKTNETIVLPEKILEVERLSIKRASWKFENKQIGELEPNEVRLGFRRVEDNPMGLIATCDFGFSTETGSEFNCRVELIGKVPRPFEEIVKDHQTRNKINLIASELIVGHIRGFLLQATSLAGLNSHLILSSVIEAVADNFIKEDIEVEAPSDKSEELQREE